MAYRTTGIRQEIERERRDLAANLAELEARMRTAVDWREQARRHPAVAFSAAFGGALAVGLGLRRGNRISHDTPVRPLARVDAMAQTGRRAGLPRQMGAAIAMTATTMLLKVLEDAAVRLAAGWRKPQ
jgi:hypothetical protein